MYRLVGSNLFCFSSYCSYESFIPTSCNTSVLHLYVLGLYLGLLLFYIKIEEAENTVPPGITDPQCTNQKKKKKELRD